MNSKERITRIFTHKIPDRIGIFDFFDEITLLNWKKQGILPEVDVVEYFDFDLDFRTENPARNRFVFFRLDGPFQRLVSKKGLQQALIDFIREPANSKNFFKESADNIFSEYKRARKEARLNDLVGQGDVFDGIWLCEDIAYDNGLYFSVEKYKDTLFNFHKEVRSFFKNEGLFVVFHCDGDVEGLMPFLVKADFSGIHPLQESDNPNIMRIKKDFKGAITFIGGIGLSHLRFLTGSLTGSDTDAVRRALVSDHRRTLVSDPVLDRIEKLKEDGDYIFCFDGPIPDDTEFNAYQNVLAEIEAVGVYV